MSLDKPEETEDDNSMAPTNNKKTNMIVLVTMLVLIGLFAVYIFTKSKPDELAWANIDQTNDTQLENFLIDFPSSEINSTAKGLLSASRERKAYRSAKDINTPEAYGNFIKTWPGGEYEKEAASSLQQLKNAEVIEKYLKHPTISGFDVVSAYWKRVPHSYSGYNEHEFLVLLRAANQHLRYWLGKSEDSLEKQYVESDISAEEWASILSKAGLSDDKFGNVFAVLGEVGSCKSLNDNLFPATRDLKHCGVEFEENIPVVFGNQVALDGIQNNKIIYYKASNSPIGKTLYFQTQKKSYLVFAGKNNGKMVQDSSCGNGAKITSLAKHPRGSFELFYERQGNTLTLCGYNFDKELFIAREDLYLGLGSRNSDVVTSIWKGNILTLNIRRNDDIVASYKINFQSGTPNILEQWVAKNFLRKSYSKLDNYNPSKFCSAGTSPYLYVGATLNNEPHGLGMCYPVDYPTKLNGMYMGEFKYGRPNGIGCISGGTNLDFVYHSCGEFDVSGALNFSFKLTEIPDYRQRNFPSKFSFLGKVVTFDVPGFYFNRKSRKSGSSVYEYANCRVRGSRMPCNSYDAFRTEIRRIIHEKAGKSVGTCKLSVVDCASSLKKVEKALELVQDMRTYEQDQEWGMRIINNE